MSEFGIDAKVNRVVTGPTFSRLELVMPKGIPVKRVLSYVDDIAMCLEVKSVRCQIPIPGKNAFGVEIPNEKRGKVGLKSVIQSEKFAHSKHKLAFAVGQNCDGENFTADLSAMPHLLIAGATGAGKSVCLNSLIVSLLYKYTPEELRLLLVDPKQVELNMYNRIPHLLIPEAVSDKDRTLNLLDWAIEEMEMRYTMFKDRRVQKITDYNAIIDPKKEEKLPYIVIIIDEVGDFMMVMKKELEERIVRLTQKARAAGIHLILATQRPSVDVITGTIKANLPARIAFAVSSFVDSKTILDQGGAEKLLRYGDMIFSDGVNDPERLQGTLIEGEEVNAICDYVRDNNECYFDKDIEEYINKFELVEGEYLFKSRKGVNKPITRQRAWQIIKQLANEVKINYVVGCHSLRKYFARTYYEQTGDLIGLSEMLNHSSERVTLIYICWEADDKEEKRKGFYLGG